MDASSFDILLVCGAGVAIAGIISTVFVKKIRLERRIYWASWIFATTLMSLAVLDRGWRSVALVAAVCFGVAWMYAYLRTSYIKIGGRVYAFTIADSRPDPPEDGSPSPPVPELAHDAYRRFLTAPKYWWTLAIISVAAGILVLNEGLSPLTLPSAVLVGTALALTGFIEAHEGFPVSRRQYVPLAVIVVASIPLFLAPPLAYLVGYFWLGGGSIARRP